jgi:hypothetical protein
MNRPFAFSLIVLAGLAAGASAQDRDRLVYRTPRGVEFEITADGLSAIRANGRDLARGHWHMWNAEDWFKAGAGDVKADKLRDKSFEATGRNRARVKHVHQDVTCLYEYTCNGEDVTVSARVENNHPEAPLNVTGFGGLEFTFGRAPDGLMVEQHISYFQAHGIGLCHPSFFCRIGGSYARDDHIGVGVSPWRTGWTRTLFLWDYTDWNLGKREKLPGRRLLYFVANPVPPRGAQTFDWKLRVSPDRDWKHLLAPYREHFRRTFGEVRYKADYRWVATDYLNHSQQAVSRENPYGFHGGHRRIDTAEGARKFCDTIIPALKEGDGQGIIVWGQGGDDPRGAMYRPDFDVLPPEVEAQWPGIARRFSQAGLRLGVTTRPHDVAVRHDWRTDGIIAINPDDPSHRDMLWARFERMQKLGCTLFYLDSFGNSLEDVKLMRFLREKLGPDVLTFAEHQSDAIFPYSGGYSESTLDATAAGRSPYHLWSGLENWEVYAWLTPGAQMAARLYEIKGKPPAGLESADRFFLRHHISPLVPVNDFARAPALKGLQREYLAGPGAWK